MSHPRSNKKENFVDRVSDWMHRYAFVIVVVIVVLVSLGREQFGSKQLFASAEERQAFFRTVSTPETRVVTLVTSWCPACRNLEAQLQQEGIQFTRIDIDESTQGRKLFERAADMSGSRGIPKVVVDLSLVSHGLDTIRQALASPAPVS
jgi:glutaredoxin